MTEIDLRSLSAQIDHAMLRDRHPLRRRLKGIERSLQAGRPVDHGLQQIAADLERSRKRVENRKQALPKPTYPEHLPVVERREDIKKAIAENQVVVLCGETGSGKTTQLPKICLELGRGVAGLIGHTQPRRIAARSVARRIAEELESPLGQTVGFKVRFADQLSENTYLKLMTDGILLAETQGDPYLEQYDTIIIDEAHERSLNIDFLLGYLRQLLPKRPDLKVIITSATIDPERFSKHFNDAPILMVSGRTYPVEVRYRPLQSQDPEEEDVLMEDAILAAVDEVLHEGPGDVLLFMTGEPTVNYVPIDPCQPLIAAIRVALGERIRREFIDLEVEHFQPYAAGFPDPYALKKLPLEKFAAAILPALDRLPKGQPRDRVRHMAHRLHELEKRYKSILVPCSILDWPWLREAYNQLKNDQAASTAGRSPHPAEVEETQILQPNEKNLIFCLGELPFITGLYEQARADLDDDENLSIDGVKDLLITARDRYKSDFKKQARPITPQLLSLLLKYIRNLSLVERRLTPDMFTLVNASQQFAGDNFALHVAETVRSYPFNGKTEYPAISLGLDQARLPDGSIVKAINRLAGPPGEWRTLELRRRPDRQEQKLWQMRWNPFRQCSWPPEDIAIERFRTHTFEKARQIIGQDLARSEKFTTSVEDGIDIRETLRNWHTGDLYVRIFPPNRGSLDAVVMLFDSPADPRDYPYRVTWHHEHQDESTLAFFATDWRKNVIGPGIAQSTYGGCMLIFPPLEPHIFDIWHDPGFDTADTMEERLLMATCAYSREKHVALLSPGPPGAAWRKIAKQFGKKLVHLPLAHFSAQTVQQLRVVHVLNGQHIRSYAAEFIRKA